MGNSVFENSVAWILSNISKRALYTEEEIQYLRSVWLPHNGYLYTTVYKAYGMDLDAI